ncbi:glycosyltransferase [Candidatus Woesearchaeota archaeon]|nr:glycosyltransferase [Candidatus Woesearchaeota archaeon]
MVFGTKKNKEKHFKKMEKETKKKKLLVATDNYLPRWDGIARFLNEIIPRIKNKYDITIISPDFGNTNHKEIKHIRIPLSKIKYGDYQAAKLDIKTIKKEVKKNDIIFTQTIGPIGLPTILQAKKQKKPIAAYTHSIEWELAPLATKNILLKKFLYPLMKIYTKIIYNKIDLLIVPSEGTKETLSWQNIRTHKEVVHLGVNSQQFKPLKERTEKEQNEIEDIKKQINPENYTLIGNHGRIAEEKDLLTLLRAFNWLQKNNEKVKLIIIGDGLERIKQKIRQTKNTILIERTNEPEKYLNLIDIYVTTSLTETTSLSTIEAMSSGTPVISTAVGFIKDYIQKNKNGFLIKQKDSYDLYKIMQLLIDNKDLAKKIGNKGRTTVTQIFNWDNTAKNITKLLKKLE